MDAKHIKLPESRSRKLAIKGYMYISPKLTYLTLHSSTVQYTCDTLKQYTRKKISATHYIYTQLLFPRLRFGCFFLTLFLPTTIARLPTHAPLFLYLLYAFRLLP